MMLSLILITLAFFQGTALGNPLNDLNHAAPFDKRSQLTCNYNNCLRVMTNTPIVASSFCSTWLQPTTYTTVTPTVTISGTVTVFPTGPTTTTAPVRVIPTHISSQCTLTTAPPLTSRLSSACSCMTIVPAPGTVTLTTYAPETTVTVTPQCDGVSLPTYQTGDETFDIYCHNYIGGGAEINIDLPGANNNFESCIMACQGIEECVGVNFYTDPCGGVLKCVIFSEIDTSYDSFPGDLAVLTSYDFVPGYRKRMYLPRSC